MFYCVAKFPRSMFGYICLEGFLSCIGACRNTVFLFADYSRCCGTSRTTSTPCKLFGRRCLSSSSRSHASRSMEFLHAPFEAYPRTELLRCISLLRWYLPQEKQYEQIRCTGLDKVALRLAQRPSRSSRKLPSRPVQTSSRRWPKAAYGYFGQGMVTPSFYILVRTTSLSSCATSPTLATRNRYRYFLRGHLLHTDSSPWCTAVVSWRCRRRRPLYFGKIW